MGFGPWRHNAFHREERILIGAKAKPEERLQVAMVDHCARLRPMPERVPTLLPEIKIYQTPSRRKSGVAAGGFHEALLGPFQVSRRFRPEAERDPRRGAGWIEFGGPAEVIGGGGRSKFGALQVETGLIGGHLYGLCNRFHSAGTSQRVCDGEAHCKKERVEEGWNGDKSECGRQRR